MKVIHIMPYLKISEWIQPTHKGVEFTREDFDTLLM